MEKTSTSKRIVVVGTGYVGLVTGTCLADSGHSVVCVDIDEAKIERLRDGHIPIYEPGLEQVVKRNVQAGRLEFSTKLKEVVPGAEVVFIAVGTPSDEAGRADLQYVFAAATDIGIALSESNNPYTVVVNKSTVPVGTATAVQAQISKSFGGQFSVASCPEFLREGSAVEDFFNPDRIVIGVDSDEAADVLRDVFATIKGQIVVTGIESAELIKYASNAFLATKISFINEISQICERTGANIEEVAYGVGLDNRIGPKFLHAGIGWGGSCFPKDVIALDQLAGDSGYDFKLLKGVIEVNQDQRKHFIEKVAKELDGGLTGKTIGVLGLAFKNNTDDIRESAAIDIIKQLVEAGATVSAFDYQATDNAKREIGEGITYASTAEDVASGADAVLVVTEWKEFIDLDWTMMKSAMKQPFVFDGRNLLKPQTMSELGFNYYSIGR